MNQTNSIVQTLASTATIGLVETLNKECFCISLDIAALKKALESEIGSYELFELVQERCPYLFAARPVFVSSAHMKRMTELVQMGIRFSIDDFGTGYSSLSYLKKLPLFELKIDKSFVNDIPENTDDTAIVQAILAMAVHLKLRVVAEGVETQAQADFLLAHHCDDLQGYLFERPMLMQSWLDKQLHKGHKLCNFPVLLHPCLKFAIL